MRHVRPSLLLLTSAAALAGFAYTARQVARRQTDDTDDRTRDGLQAARTPQGDAVAEAAGPLGKEWLHFPIAAVLALGLRYRGLGWRAGVPMLASAASEALGQALDRAVPRQEVPPGHPQPHKQSFPSNHAFETTAVALTSAYVLTREKIAPVAPAFAVAVVLSVASPLGRLYLDRHWISDVVGGALLGVSLAAASCAAYEVLPAKARPGRPTTTFT